MIHILIILTCRTEGLGEANAIISKEAAATQCSEAKSMLGYLCGLEMFLFLSGFRLDYGVVIFCADLSWPVVLCEMVYIHQENIKA